MVIPKSADTLVGQIVYHLRANPRGIWVNAIARRIAFVVPLSEKAKIKRVEYFVYGVYRPTKKSGVVRYPRVGGLWDQIRIVRIEGSNKLIALKKEARQ